MLIEALAQWIYFGIALCLKKEIQQINKMTIDLLSLRHPYPSSVDSLRWSSTASKVVEVQPTIYADVGNYDGRECNRAILPNFNINHTSLYLIKNKKYMFFFFFYGSIKKNLTPYHTFIPNTLLFWLPKSSDLICFGYRGQWIL